MSGISPTATSSANDPSVNDLNAEPLRQFVKRTVKQHIDSATTECKTADDKFKKRIEEHTFTYTQIAPLRDTASRRHDIAQSQRRLGLKIRHERRKIEAARDNPVKPEGRRLALLNQGPNKQYPPMEVFLKQRGLYTKLIENEEREIDNWIPILLHLGTIHEGERDARIKSSSDEPPSYNYSYSFTLLNKACKETTRHQANIEFFRRKIDEVELLIREKRSSGSSDDTNADRQQAEYGAALDDFNSLSVVRLATRAIESASTPKMNKRLAEVLNQLTSLQVRKSEEKDPAERNAKLINSFLDLLTIEGKARDLVKEWLFGEWLPKPSNDSEVLLTQQPEGFSGENNEPEAPLARQLQPFSSEDTAMFKAYLIEEKLPDIVRTEEERTHPDLIIANAEKSHRAMEQHSRIFHRDGKLKSRDVADLARHFILHEYTPLEAGGARQTFQDDMDIPGPPDTVTIPANESSRTDASNATTKASSEASSSTLHPVSIDGSPQRTTNVDKGNRSLAVALKEKTAMQILKASEAKDRIVVTRRKRPKVTFGAKAS